MPRPSYGERERIIARVVRPNERYLVDRPFERGHDVPCRFCGHKSADHAEVKEDKESTTVIKGKRLSLWICSWTVGYIPANLSIWNREEKSYLAETGTEERAKIKYQIEKARRDD
jgi:hypothetical protein